MPNSHPLTERLEALNALHDALTQQIQTHIEGHDLHPPQLSTLLESYHSELDALGLLATEQQQLNTYVLRCPDTSRHENAFCAEVEKLSNTVNRWRQGETSLSYVTYDASRITYLLAFFLSELQNQSTTPPD